MSSSNNSFQIPGTFIALNNQSLIAFFIFLGLILLFIIIIIIAIILQKNKPPNPAKDNNTKNVL